MTVPRRVGILGGSFDPPHTGHLLVAQDAREALGLDLLLVIPAATQPLKRDGQTPAEHRLAMVTRCFEGVDGIVVDPMEIARGGISFMVDTVEALRRRWPNAALSLLVGADVVATLPRWREPERLLGMAQLVILRRSADGSDAGPVADVDAATPLGKAITAAPRLATRRFDVSSTEIRARVQAGLSLRGFVPPSVEAYIAAHGLYGRAPQVEDASVRA